MMIDPMDQDDKPIVLRVCCPSDQYPTDGVSVVGDSWECLVGSILALSMCKECLG